MTTSWLAEHLHDFSLVIFHVAPIRRDYGREHIQAARFLWPGGMVMSNPELNDELLPVAQMVSMLEAFSRLSATLPYLAARALGYSVSLYDGSWEDWSERDD